MSTHLFSRRNHSSARATEITKLPTLWLGWIGPEEQTNLPKQSILDSELVQAAKALCKVQIEKFNLTKLQWSRWKQMFELQMLANTIPKSYWVKLVGHYLDDRSYFVYDYWPAQVTGDQQIMWEKLASMMES